MILDYDEFTKTVKPEDEEPVCGGEGCEGETPVMISEPEPTEAVPSIETPEGTGVVAEPLPEPAPEPQVDGAVMNPEPAPEPLPEPPADQNDNPAIGGVEPELTPAEGENPPCENEPTTYCNTDNLTLGEFFGTLMESVQIAWRYHLKATNHSTHVILEEYYSDAQEIIDTIIESYQGRFGVITEYGNRICDFDKSCLGYFQELRDFIENGKLMLPEINCSSEILSEIDTLTTKVDTTLYKLRNLTESKKRPFKSFEEFIND